MDVRLLGPFEVEHEGRILGLGGARQRSVLALLAIHANQPVSFERIVDELWGDEPPASAIGTLQAYISHLRRALAGAPATIESRGRSYVLVADPHDLDAHRFEQLVDSAGEALTREDAASATTLLRDALALWRGPALADFAYEPFAEVEASRLDELRLAAIEQRMEAELALGRHREVVAELESLVSEHPLREGLRGQLMRALYGSGQRAEALRAYQQGREQMIEELGLEPGTTLQRLEQAILQDDPELEAPAPASRRPSTTGNLPAPLTSFVGRRAEVADVARLLGRHRLVTLTGPGGSGKTRLSLHAGAEVAPAYPGGVWLVELAALRDPTLVLGAVAAVLGVREDPHRPLRETVAEALSQRPTLLVVDNCEHLLDAAGRLAEGLLRGCPDLRMLATSREPLRLSGEAAWPVPPLPADDAARLFIERATAADPAFEPDEDDAAAIAQVCQRLDGMPLAIELAAARLRVLSVAQLAERLRDRFRLLTDGTRDALAHHRTLEAAVEWSYDLLADDERLLFERLSLFAGDFTLESTEEVCADDGLARDDVLDLLSSLVNKSLVVRVNHRGPQARYRLLETLREFGARRLADGGGEDLLRVRHAAHFTTVAEDGDRRLYGPDTHQALDQLEAAMEDFRSALGWLGEHGSADDELRLGGALWRFWDHRSHVAEGRQHLRHALARDGAADRWTLAALVGNAYLAWVDDDFDDAVAQCETGLAIANRSGDRWGRAKLLSILGEVTRHHGNDPSRTQALCEEAVDLFAEVGDRWEEAHTTRVLVLVAWDRGDLEEATRLAERCLRLWLACGDVENSAGARSMLAGLAKDRGELQDAAELYELSLAEFQQAGQPWGAAHVMRSLGALVGERGEYERAMALGDESLRLHEELGNRRGVAESLKVMGDAALQLGDLPRADRLCADALERFRERGFSGDVTVALSSLARVALTKGQLDRAVRLCEEALVQYRETGQKRDAAPALCLLSTARSRQGEATEGESLAEESLTLFRETGDDRGVARGLEAVAEAALGGGEPERAARFLSAARTIREECGAPLTPAERPDHLHLLQEVRAALGDTTFARSWAAEWEHEVVDLRQRRARLA